MRKTLILVLVLAVGITLGAPGNQVLNAQPKASPIAVETKGLHPTVKFEEVLSGHLTDLNGKYKLRVTEVTFDPDGYIGDHQHRGPGIRFLTSGELTMVQEGKTTVHKAGDYWFESGAITTSCKFKNKTARPATLLQFEILPADLKGGSAFVPLK